MDEATRKRTLRLFPSPIFVVGCCDGSRVHAFAGSWMGQCSFDPPLLWIGVRVGSRPEKFIDAGGVFTISILSAEQQDTAAAFFRTPEPCDGKFGEIPYRLSPLGAPILEDCLAWVECRVARKVVPGCHAVYYGEVHECRFFEEAPVLTTVTTGWKYGG